MAIEMIFWDNDGVLVETEPLYFQATCEVFAELGVTLSRQDYEETYLRDNRGAWHLLGDCAADLNWLEAQRLRRNARYTELLHANSTVCPGAEAVLAALYPSTRMAVVTSSRGEHFEAIHETTGFRRFFEFVLVREDYAQSKPDPESYLLALRRSGCPPASALVIEDSPRGLAAATAAGLRCWVIPSTLTLTENADWAAADRVLGSITEIPALLKSAPLNPQQ
jgi:HAD superfamily hydrolase (TIGR01509 family)